MPILRILTGGLKGKVFEISENEIFIGRDQENEIRLDESSISKRHAVVFPVGEICFIRDLKSRNGTFLNNVRISEEILHPGDKIKIGGANIAYEEKSQSKEKENFDIKYEEDEDRFIKKESLQKAEEEKKHDLVSRNLETLYTFSQNLSQIKEQEDILQLSLQTLKNILQADSIYIFLKDKKKNIVPKAIFEKEKKKIPPVSRGIIKMVLKEHKGLMTSDAASDSRFRENVSIIKRKVKSVICSPIISRQQVNGVIYISGTAAVNIFFTEDLDLVNSIALWIGLALDNVKAYKKQFRMLLNMLKSLVMALELVMPETHGHAMRVASFSGAIAKAKELSKKKIHICQLAGYLHDIGKIASGQPQDLEDEEKKKKYEEHVSVASKMLEEMEGMEELIPAVKYHHELYDGSGFPEQLTGDNIPEIARIVGLANYFDHLVHDPKEDGNKPEIKEVIQKLKEVSGIKFNYDDVMALREAHRKGDLKDFI